MDPQDPQDPQELQEDTTLRTRSGYAVADAVHSFRAALQDSGSAAAAKSLHYTADLICSGCFELWQKILQEYCLDHVGIASPRIFWYLKRRFSELETAWAKLPAETFYRTVDYQKAFAETILVIRSAPRRPALKMPKVPAETHNEEWVRNATQGTPPSAVVGRVFRNSNDLLILRRIGDEFAKACADGNTEKALQWMKWCLEEDARVRRDTGGSLSTAERGPSTWTSKQRSGVGFYLATLLAEIQKDLAPKTGLRMNEEFQAILNLYCYPNKGLTSRRRTELLSLLIQIVCEVPRWKVPAAPSLVKDPVVLERAIGHAESFFREVLAQDIPAGDVAKEAKKTKKANVTTISAEKNAKKLKQMSVEEHLNAQDAMINSWMNGTL